MIFRKYNQKKGNAKDVAHFLEALGGDQTQERSLVVKFLDGNTRKKEHLRLFMC